MNLRSSRTQNLPLPPDCPRCDPGSYVIENCTASGQGVRCETCTNCTDLGQVTLGQCSPFTDAVCGRMTMTVSMTTQLFAPPPGLEAGSTILFVTLLSLVLVLILSLVLVLVLGSGPTLKAPLKLQQHKGLEAGLEAGLRT
ncbi:tumor necrosis factor receptor superfamily member 9-like isoform X2 [Sphaeramia orbicularis]|nr:tumor necrosis factor receptor superfamily member 9-like isoform X2 [Sphaeramia orbicularis]